jgi:outer membrane receptor protein involved in Fe transport
MYKFMKKKSLWPNMRPALLEIKHVSGIMKWCFMLLLTCVSMTSATNADSQTPRVKLQNTKRITGTVLDATGEPVVGANIIEKGADNGTVADINGNFSLNVRPNASLQISFIGYLTQEVNVSSIGDGKPLVIRLIENAQILEEVVVVGYGTQRRVNLTGAVDQVSSEVFENRPITNITQGLVGAIPNLNIAMTDGKPTNSPAYNIRGTTSIGQGGNALVLIDGVEGDPRMLNPNDIESVSCS